MSDTPPQAQAPTVITPVPEAEPPPYQRPLLRAHGALHELTHQQKSGDNASDADLKENVLAVRWEA